MKEMPAADKTARTQSVPAKCPSLCPPNIRALIKVSPPPILDSRNKLVLLWSAKAGCTFALKWMFDHMGLLEEAISYHPWIHNYRDKKLTLSDRHKAAIEDFCNSPSSYRVVKFVRQPFKRAVSSYIHALRCKYEDSKIATFLGVGLDETFRFSFREFVRYLSTLDLRKCDIHHRLQTHPFERHAIPASSFLINVDDAMESLPKLEAFLGLSRMNLSRYKQSHHHTRTSSSSAIQSSADILFEMPEKRSPVLPDYRTFYDADLEHSVYKLYAEDFLRYGFSTRLDVPICRK